MALDVCAPARPRPHPAGGDIGRPARPLPALPAILDIGNLVRPVGKEQMNEVFQPPGGLVNTAVACVAASLQCLLQIRQCAELMFVRCKRNAVVPRFMAQCKRFS